MRWRCAVTLIHQSLVTWPRSNLQTSLYLRDAVKAKWSEKWGAREATTNNQKIHLVPNELVPPEIFLYGPDRRWLWRDRAKKGGEEDLLGPLTLFCFVMKCILPEQAGSWACSFALVREFASPCQPFCSSSKPSLRYLGVSCLVPN